MIAWILVGVILVGTVLMLFWRLPRRKPGAGEGPSGSAGGAAPPAGASRDQSSRSGAASRWLQSLVKAEDDERKTRRGSR